MNFIDRAEEMLGPLPDTASFQEKIERIVLVKVLAEELIKVYTEGYKDGSDPHGEIK